MRYNLGVISFVYLDVGGVANIDFSGNTKWDELRAELGITPENRAAFDRIWDEYFPKVCIDYEINDLVPILRRELGLSLPDGYSLLDGFLKRFEPNPSIWPVTEAMKRQVPVGLLTNMYIGMFDAILKTGMLPPVKWDVVIDSSIEGCQKPEVEIFELAQAKAGVPAGQILFADNSREHVEAAAALGWQTFLYDSSNPQQSSNDLLEFFQAHLRT